MTKSELIQRLAEMYPDPRLYHRDFERVVMIFPLRILLLEQ